MLARGVNSALFIGFRHDIWVISSDANFCKIRR
jgi:hypothetical protein